MTRKDNYWAGWNSYRYGPSKKPTLPRILKGQRREHVVSRIFDILNDFQSSPFQNEGAARAGLRSALCLGGYRWAIADNEAASVVAEGLRLMGAKRPEWSEGQREYTTPVEDCVRCGRPLDEELREGNRKFRFCSADCARAYRSNRSVEGGKRYDGVVWSAYSLLKRESNPPRPCAECGEMFRPIDASNVENIYCSPKCRAGARRHIQERACRQCGTMFRPRDSATAGIFCSLNCRIANVKERTFERVCLYCGEVFTATTDTAKYCSTKHLNRAHHVARQIEKMKETGRPYVPRGADKELVQRMIDAAFADGHRVATKFVVTPAEEPAPVHMIHELLDVARRAPALHRPLTAAVFDQCFARAA